MKCKSKMIIQRHLNKKWKNSFKGVNIKENTKWLLCNLTVAFSLYWAGNLLLWFPWSSNANLGIGLMLTIMPLLWGIGIYYCLIRYKGEKILTGVIINSIIMLVSAVVSDYIFFGLIRGALDDLYQPATFYGYGFLIIMPFLELLFFKKLIIKKRCLFTTDNFISAGAIGLFSILILIAIIKFDIKI
ncbi:MAG: hypothetical protein ACM3RX_00395 [Methanococcaceae archaeon]